MTNKEAIKALRLEGGLEIGGNARRLTEFMEALDVAISALQRVEWEDTLWHDAMVEQKSRGYADFKASKRNLGA